MGNHRSRHDHASQVSATSYSFPMNETSERSPRLSLPGLKAAQRDAVFVHCNAVSLPEGVTWIKSEFNIDINPDRLSAWLRRQRIVRSATLPSRKINPHCKIAKLSLE